MKSIVKFLKRKEFQENVDTEKLEQLIELVEDMDEQTEYQFVVDSLVKKLTEGKHLKALKEFPGRPPLYEQKPDEMPFYIPTDRPVINDDVEALRSLYGFRNNEIKELLGISDTSITKMKKNPQDILEDPPVALILRFFSLYPDLLLDKAKGDYDLSAIVNWLGGIERQVGVLIGRNYFSGYRYIKKGQKGTISVQIMKSILVHFLKEEKMADFYEVLKIEAKARGIKDVFEHGSWDPGKSSQAGE